MNDDGFDPRARPLEPETLDLRVFDQDQPWVDRTGRVHDLNDMPLDYLVNLMMYLRQLAETFYARHLAALILDTLDGMRDDLPMPETADAWLHGTKLYRRLLTLIAQDERPRP